MEQAHVSISHYLHTDTIEGEPVNSITLGDDAFHTDATVENLMHVIEWAFHSRDCHWDRCYNDEPGSLSIYGNGVVMTDSVAGTEEYPEVVVYITGAPDSVLQAVIKGQIAD